MHTGIKQVEVDKIEKIAGSKKKKKKAHSQWTHAHKQHMRKKKKTD